MFLHLLTFTCTFWKKWVYINLCWYFISYETPLPPVWGGGWRGRGKGWTRECTVKYELWLQILIYEWCLKILTSFATYTFSCVFDEADKDTFLFVFFQPNEQFVIFGLSVSNLDFFNLSTIEGEFGRSG